jgi:hypothetical protein
MPATSTATATPSPAAIRAAEQIVSDDAYARSAAVERAAKAIDRETGLPELAEHLQNLVDCYGVGWKTHKDFCEAVRPLMEEARAALARFNARTE